MQDLYRPSGESSRLRDLFREANRQSKQVMLSLATGAAQNLNLAGSKDYATGLAKLVRLLSEQGLRATAVEANILAERVELLLDLLHVEMTELL